MLGDKNRFIRIDPKRTVIARPSASPSWPFTRILLCALALFIASALVFTGGIVPHLALVLWPLAALSASASLYVMFKP